MSSALEAPGLNHWTIREAPGWPSFGKEWCGNGFSSFLNFFEKYGSSIASMVNLGAWDKFVSNQITKQSAESLYQPCLLFFYPRERGILALSEISSERHCLGDFSGGPVAKTPCSQSRGLGV